MLDALTAARAAGAKVASARSLLDEDLVFAVMGRKARFSGGEFLRRASWECCC